MHGLRVRSCAYAARSVLRYHRLFSVRPGSSINANTVNTKASNNNFKSVRQSYDDNRHSDFTFSDDLGNTTKVKQEYALNISSVKSLFHDLIWYFLPRGYPQSIVPGYDRFALGQLVSITMGTTCGVLSMQSMLFAIGAGSGSLPLAATLNWIIKDGLGQFGGILFASIINNKFDSDPKRWRMIASISMDASSLLELLTPLCPAYFLPMASVANVGKNISYLSASASRAAIHKSFCLHENLADITVKSGSQSILGSLVGTGLGLAIAASVGQQYESVLAAFLACSAISLGATYASLKHVTITTVSLGRLDYLLQDYIEKSCSQMQRESSDSTRYSIPKVPELLTPDDLRLREEYLGEPLSCLPVLHIGADLNDAIKTKAQLEYLVTFFENDGYLLNCYMTDSTTYSEVHLLLKEDSTLHDMIRGLSHAYILRNMIKQQYDHKDTKWVSSALLASTSSTATEWGKDLIYDSYLQMKDDNLIDNFTIKLLEKGKHNWLVDPLILEPRKARFVQM